MRKVLRWSVTMVTTYDVLSSRWSNHFWVKMHVLFTFFNNKRKTCQWNDAKGLFKCYFTCEAQKIIIYRDFNLISNSWWNPRWRSLLVTSQGLQQRYPPLKINLMLLSRRKAFHWRQNRFEILQIIRIKNPGEGFHPPLTLIPRWGMNGCVRPRVNPVKLIWIICFSHLL